MTNRFRKDRHKNRGLGLLVPVITFVIIIGLFLYGIRQVSATSVAEQKKSLENIIERDVVHCYASEGAYPSSLDELETKYGRTYDHSRFLVDYQPIGENIVPEITILEVSHAQ